MCGIAGVCHLNGEAVSFELLKKMTAVMAYRGPDDEGFYTKGGIGLGHRRLSILDLSPAGHQPMSNDDSTAVITYNGEVYNFRELRKELEAQNVSFRSQSDTEVILKAYEAWGEKCVLRFNGMFAFALWDSKRKRLFCARDRFGIKPL